MPDRTLYCIPQDTERAAQHLFDPHHPYLLLGKDIHRLEGTAMFAALPAGRPNAMEAWQFALITIFQYKEQRTDMQAVDALRERVDWKFALHLPMLALEPRAERLCAFRCSLMTDPRAQQAFQKTLDQLHASDFLLNGPHAAAEILRAVCCFERLHRLTRAMMAALAALVLEREDWLRQVMLPHWYNRYHPRRMVRFYPAGDWRWAADSLGRDSFYLIQQVALSGSASLKHLEEVQELENLWRENYELLGDFAAPCAGTPERSCRWREPFCLRCAKAASQDTAHLNSSGNINA